MRRAFLWRVLEILHLLALSIWCGSVGMSGVVAAIVFPTMRNLEPTLGAFSGYDGDHALLGAGRIASQVFFAVDIIQFVCACVALGTIAVLVVSGYSLNTAGRVLRVMVLCMTLALLSYHLFFFMPGLMDSLRGYWELAKQGQSAQADVFKDQFLASHTRASLILGSLTLMVLLNIVIAVWTLTERTRVEEQR